MFDDIAYDVILLRSLLGAQGETSTELNFLKKEAERENRERLK